MQFFRVFDWLSALRNPLLPASACYRAARPSSRLATRLSRFGDALLQIKIPRGLGSSAAAVFLLASVVYGAVRGGHGPEIVSNLHDLCDDVANGLGFRISEVSLTGERELSRERVLAIAGVTGHSSLLFLDPATTRARLLGNPWIAEATVLKLYPGRLRIELKERKPFALWQQGGKVYVIADDGTVLENYIEQRFAALPLVVGAGA